MKVTVGGQKYSIVHQKPVDGGLVCELAWGRHESGKNRITVDSTLPVSRQQKILIHEILHAIVYDRGIKQFYRDQDTSQGHDEALIDAVSGGLLEALSSLGLKIPHG